jgi:hypothetical protein
VTTSEQLVEKVARALCCSGKYETGEGTCAMLCMEFLGDPRKNGCGHAVRIHGDRARAAISLTLEEAAGVADDAATDVSLRIDGMVRTRAAQRRIDAWKERRNGLLNLARALRERKP